MRLETNKKTRSQANDIWEMHEASLIKLSTFAFEFSWERIFMPEANRK